ncbi:hypothetical protein TWF718_008358 [Orbilia javanica]|uniref:F-box domain-containing protein n=1 Tax=Orbilia javanica TaxID=47235 RepID=A0AAN8MMW9_9PEZI
MQRLLSLPEDVQIEILGLLDLESQVAASVAYNPWASLLLSCYSTQIPRRFPECHPKTGFHNLPAILDSGRNNWYIKTTCELGTVYTYLFIKSRGGALDFNSKGYITVPEIEDGKDISNCPLLNDLIFPPREFNVQQPPKTSITPLGEVEVNNDPIVKRVKRKPFTPFFIILENSWVIAPDSSRPFSHRLYDPRVIDWRDKTFKFSVYKNAVVADLIQVGVDMLWDLNRMEELTRKDGVYQVFVEI